jgi:hypothetical protein
MKVRTRRWFCDEPMCPRKIFAERFDDALARYARRTAVADDLLKTFVLQAGGEAGARLARKAGVPVSPDTLLRLLRAIQDQAVPTPRVLGVDDLALREVNDGTARSWASGCTRRHPGRRPLPFIGQCQCGAR